MSLEESLGEFVKDILSDEYDDIKKEILDDVSSQCDDIIESKLGDIDFVDTERLTSLLDEMENLERKCRELTNAQASIIKDTSVLFVITLLNAAFSIVVYLSILLFIG